MSAVRVALVAGEHSGDQLGGKLMRALREAHTDEVAFLGVGGEAMDAEGLKSLFPISDIAVMGILPVLARLPRLIARIRRTAEAIIAARPDALVIIDSPDFTHRVARRVRAALPKLPIVDYVSPSVWAWRPGRAKAMRAYVDCVLALLPFEPEAYRRLKGPRCVYVGHPLIERLAALRPNADEARRRAATPPLIVVLPGSRRSEVSRLMADFGGALEIVRQSVGPFRVVLPTLPHVEREVRALAATLAGTAENRARRRGKIRRLSRRARGPRGVGNGHARTRAGWRADGRRLQGVAGRGTTEVPDKGPLDPVAQPHPRRAGDPGVSSTRVRAARARRGALGRSFGRPGARRATRRFVAA